MYTELHVCLGSELSDDDTVPEMVLAFNLKSSANVSSVRESERGDTDVISFTSGHIRAMSTSFPEVLHAPDKSVR
ncbi:hypothetical protein JG688_00015143 [Phytophthora aleatoria]|uniref:Uncharacterized protein n=1 Tax=Phytophthora aleatoria TaxID=2496075 RepID=A0A8J5IW31_9STRA|nr:hypothetical protein JG688_00015143 [Phytophthora aleatoria]